MSARFVMSSLAGVLVLGGVAAATVTLVGTADAAGTDSRPTIDRATASPLVLGTTGTEKLAVSTTVSDNSGIKNVKVLAWPKSSGLDPKAAEMRHVENATCKESSAKTSTCTYSDTTDAKKGATDVPTGSWYVALLVTAKDGDTTFAPKATTFTVTRRAA